MWLLELWAMTPCWLCKIARIAARLGRTLLVSSALLVVSGACDGAIDVGKAPTAFLVPHPDLRRGVVRVIGHGGVQEGWGSGLNVPLKVEFPLVCLRHANSLRAGMVTRHNSS